MGVPGSCEIREIPYLESAKHPFAYLSSVIETGYPPMLPDRPRVGVSKRDREEE